MVTNLSIAGWDVCPSSFFLQISKYTHYIKWTRFLGHTIQKRALAYMNIAFIKSTAMQTKWAQHPPVGFLPFTQKIFKQPILENSWLFLTFYCGCPDENKFQKNSFISRRELLGHPIQKYFKFFCFKQKIFLQTLVEIIFGLWVGKIAHGRKD